MPRSSLQPWILAIEQGIKTAAETRKVKITQQYFAFYREPQTFVILPEWLKYQTEMLFVVEMPEQP